MPRLKRPIAHRVFDGREQRDVGRVTRRALYESRHGSGSRSSTMIALPPGCVLAAAVYCVGLRVREMLKRDSGTTWGKSTNHRR